MTGSAFGCTCTCWVCTASVLPELSTERNLNVVVWLIVNGAVKTGLAVVGVDPSVV